MTDQSKAAEPASDRGTPLRSGLSPRKKQQISRTVQYVVLVAAAIMLVLYVDWASLAQNFAKPEVAKETLPELFTVALINTIIYSVGGFILAFLFGLLLALMRLSSVG